MSEHNKALIRRLVDDHWNARNQSLAAGLYASAVSLHTPDGVLSGVEAAGSLVHTYATAFPDFHVELHDLIADGDRVAVRYTFTGTHHGPIAGISATGKRVRVPNCVLFFRVADGKIIEGHFAWNRYGLLQQLGALGASGERQTMR
jgi:steroid delta-isomerase-like uncharacterized protein